MSHLIEGVNRWLRHSGESSDILTYEPFTDTHTASIVNVPRSIFESLRMRSFAFVAVRKTYSKRMHSCIRNWSCSKIHWHSMVSQLPLDRLSRALLPQSLME